MNYRSLSCILAIAYQSPNEACADIQFKGLANCGNPNPDTCVPDMGCF